ncbi:hypothetical protein TRFO_05158 [Tritrichomonas foetus]|uniref:Uncharacterized protein n=1 Tax=Tritrichomonas foetus TaxID=1144522 RepID=A0A1J4KD06_9EUKA|nr:hypothetical protein TRFO_05158 [Tritrichomonas foetus]|eukprot:OHT07534.1 hypothetical protein TRFO_05158 [Tritrichomonas foetus]
MRKGQIRHQNQHQFLMANFTDTFIFQAPNGYDLGYFHKSLGLDIKFIASFTFQKRYYIYLELTRKTQYSTLLQKIPNISTFKYFESTGSQFYSNDAPEKPKQVLLAFYSQAIRDIMNGLSIGGFSIHEDGFLAFEGANEEDARHLMTFLKCIKFEKFKAVDLSQITSIEVKNCPIHANNLFEVFKKFYPQFQWILSRSNSKRGLIKIALKKTEDPNDIDRLVKSIDQGIMNGQTLEVTKKDFNFVPCFNNFD